MSMTRLIMNEDSHVPSGPDTARERVVTQRRGNGDDGAAANARMPGGDCLAAAPPSLGGWAESDILA